MKRLHTETHLWWRVWCWGMAGSRGWVFRRPVVQCTCNWIRGEDDRKTLLQLPACTYRVPKLSTNLIRIFKLHIHSYTVAENGCTTTATNLFWTELSQLFSYCSIYFPWITIKFMVSFISQEDIQAEITRTITEFWYKWQPIMKPCSLNIHVCMYTHQWTVTSCTQHPYLETSLYLPVAAWLPPSALTAFLLATK